MASPISRGPESGTPWNGPVDIKCTATDNVGHSNRVTFTLKDDDAARQFNGNAAAETAAAMMNGWYPDNGATAGTVSASTGRWIRKNLN